MIVNVIGCDRFCILLCSTRLSLLLHFRPFSLVSFRSLHLSLFYFVLFSGGFRHLAFLP